MTLQQAIKIMHQVPGMKLGYQYDNWSYMNTTYHATHVHPIARRINRFRYGHPIKFVCLSKKEELDMIMWGLIKRHYYACIYWLRGINPDEE